MKKIFPVLVLLFLFSVLFWPAAVFGQVDPPVSPIGQIRDTGDDAGTFNAQGEGYNAQMIVTVTVRLMNWFSWFVALSSVVMGLYSGFLFITARGNAPQLETARQILIYAVVGIAVAILAFSIVTITKTFTGVVPN